MELVYEELNSRTGHEAGRALLEKTYRRLYGRKMPQILVTEQGKPYFADGSAHFSISHTKNHVFLCLHHENVGIDAEETDRHICPELTQRFLSPREQARLENAPDRRAALLRLWVLKESYAKLTGRGWGNYLRETDFDPEDPRVQMIDGCFVAVLEEKESNYAV